MPLDASAGRRERSAGGAESRRGPPDGRATVEAAHSFLCLVCFCRRSRLGPVRLSLYGLVYALTLVDDRISFLFFLF